MKKFEFSKVILIMVYATAVIFTGILAWLAYLGIDISAVANVILSIWGLVSVAVGFYYWKAKAENLMKIAKEMPQEIIEDLDEIKAFVE